MSLSTQLLSLQINCNTSRCDVMLRACNDARHPFWYAQVLGMYHILVQISVLGQNAWSSYSYSGLDVTVLAQTWETQTRIGRAFTVR